MLLQLRYKCNMLFVHCWYIMCKIIHIVRYLLGVLRSVGTEKMSFKWDSCGVFHHNCRRDIVMQCVLTELTITVLFRLHQIAWVYHGSHELNVRSICPINHVYIKNNPYHIEKMWSLIDLAVGLSFDLHHVYSSDVHLSYTVLQRTSSSHN